MSGWSLFQDEVRKRLDQLAASGCPDPLFRGHNDSTWKLLPSLSRQLSNPKWHDNKEARLFHAFNDLGAHLIPANSSEWAVLFQMQHYGIPTRLLDWTTTFANALYFALQKSPVSPTVWILNPYELNNLASGQRKMGDMHRAYKKSYIEFLDMPTKPVGAYACVGDNTVARIRHQRGNFTVHGDFHLSLEKYCPDALSKHVLPLDAIEDAKEFLQLAGINEFQIFPDLDGLARYITKLEL